uniref:Uncharacterized protein n=1 Tax=Arundo donax TaxID=35708 RepID=A0A0A8ZDG6_ARUDO
MDTNITKKGSNYNILLNHLFEMPVQSQHHTIRVNKGCKQCLVAS